MEPARKPFEASWEAQRQLGGPGERLERGGQRKKEKKTEQSGGTIGDRPLRGRGPKERKNGGKK